MSNRSAPGPRQFDHLQPAGDPRYRRAVARHDRADLRVAAVRGLRRHSTGDLAAVWYQSFFDHAMRVVTVAGLAIASFWFAIILQMIFAMELDWLPLRGRFPVRTCAALAHHRDCIWSIAF